MIKTFSRLLAVLLCCFVFISLAAPVYADAADYPIRQAPLDQENDPNDPDAAQNISGHKLITDHTGFHSIKHLFNKNKFLLHDRRKCQSDSGIPGRDRISVFHFLQGIRQLYRYQQ